MGVEKESLMLVSLMDVADSLLDRAKQSQQISDKALAHNLKATQTLSKTNNEIIALINSFPDQVKRAIAENLTGAADTAANHLTSRFNEANKQAALAANRYEKAGRHFGWKAAAIFITALLMTTGIAICATWYMSIQTASLFNDRAVLTAFIHVVKNGKGTDLHFCGDREDISLCTYVGEKGRRKSQRLVSVSLDQYSR